MKRLLVAVFAGLALAACSTAPTVYGPAASSTDAGYRQTRIESDRYRVSFRGNPDLKREQVEDMALRRAAELTVQDGFDWFRVVSRDTEQVGGRGRSEPRGGVGVGTSSGSYGSHTSVGLGLSFDLTPDNRKFETTLEVLMGRGSKPYGEDAYDARDVLGRMVGR
ncbi:MAG: hypothetical protein GC155_17875 [Alphaproteobacteria bacterium]|nr:hypothetical protein [Alphaproteobacteria bacterium]